MSERQYHITHRADTHTGVSALDSSYNMPDDATFEQLERRAALLDEVAWARIAVQNERRWVKNEVLQWERKQRITLAKKEGKKIRESEILQDEINLATAQVAIEAELRANAKLDGKDPDALMQKLKDEVAAHTKAA